MEGVLSEETDSQTIKEILKVYWFLVRNSKYILLKGAFKNFFKME